MTPSFIECVIKVHTHPPHLSIPSGKTIWSCSLFWVIFTYEESLEKYNFVVSKRDMIYIFVKKKSREVSMKTMNVWHKVYDLLRNKTRFNQANFLKLCKHHIHSIYNFKDLVNNLKEDSAERIQGSAEILNRFVSIT